MKNEKFILTVLLILAAVNGCFCQYSVVLEKTRRQAIQDVEQPSLHVAPVVYYKPALLFLNSRDTLSETVYWRRNFTDQFLETWSDNRMYPASRIFGFIQDSVYYRSTTFDDYHIFVPLIFKDRLSLYYTRYIQNLGEIRMISSDANNPDYQNRMIVTGEMPRRYANEFTYYVTFPWDTLKMIPVTRKSLPSFAQTYLRAYPEAYQEAQQYFKSPGTRIATFVVIPVTVIATSVFLLNEGKPVHYIGIGAGALLTYLSVKIFIKPKMLDPEAMIGILEKCK